MPFCRVRCGYCDFNTYTARRAARARSSADYAAQAVAEVRLGPARARATPGLPARAVSTVFFGGGTPTLLPVGDLAAMLARRRDAWGLAPGAEVTTEANPDSRRRRLPAGARRRGLHPRQLRHAVGRAAACSRPSSARTTPSAIPLVVRWAREAGLEVSLDLIYGTPGETLDDWRALARRRARAASPTTSPPTR